jgi:hypothetical protein
MSSWLRCLFILCVLGADVFAFSPAHADDAATKWNGFMPQQGFDKAACLFAVDDAQWKSLWARFDEEPPNTLPSDNIGVAVIVPAGGDCYDRLPRIEVEENPAADSSAAYVAYYWDSLSGMVCTGVTAHMHVVIELIDLADPRMRNFNNKIRFGEGRSPTEISDCQQSY